MSGVFNSPSANQLSQYFHHKLRDHCGPISHLMWINVFMFHVLYQQMLTVCVSVYFVGNQATVRICALCMLTMPPVAVGGRPLVACQHAGRWWRVRVVGVGEGGTGGGGGGARGVVSGDKARQMGPDNEAIDTHPACQQHPPSSFKLWLFFYLFPCARV